MATSRKNQSLIFICERTRNPLKLKYFKSLSWALEKRKIVLTSHQEVSFISLSRTYFAPCLNSCLGKFITALEIILGKPGPVVQVKVLFWLLRSHRTSQNQLYSWLCAVHSFSFWQGLGESRWIKARSGYEDVSGCCGWYQLEEALPGLVRDQGLFWRAGVSSQQQTESPVAPPPHYVQALQSYFWASLGWLGLKYFWPARTISSPHSLFPADPFPKDPWDSGGANAGGWGIVGGCCLSGAPVPQAGRGEGKPLHQRAPEPPSHRSAGCSDPTGDGRPWNMWAPEAPPGSRVPWCRDDTELCRVRRPSEGSSCVSSAVRGTNWPCSPWVLISPCAPRCEHSQRPGSLGEAPWRQLGLQSGGHRPWGAVLGSWCPSLGQSWAVASSGVLLTVPNVCAPNDNSRSKRWAGFSPYVFYLRFGSQVQAWSHFRCNWESGIRSLALVPKLGIAWKQILISLFNRDLKTWKARCTDEWRLMRSHLEAITSNAIAVGGRQAHLAVSHAGINQEEVFWSLQIHFDLYWCDWEHSLALWGCRMINMSPNSASGYVIFFFFCRWITWKENRNLYLIKGLLSHKQ